jgi:hypothetical protein
MGDAAVSGSLLARQASFLNKLGQNDLAEKQAYLALDKIRATDNVAEISYLHAVLGMIHSNRSQYLQARQQFEQSWAGYEQLSDDWGKAKVAYSLGKLCNAQGNLVEAAVST